jgi:inner membrane protein
VPPSSVSGILDTFTDGGLGIALFWPFSATRYFAPWRPVPVAPIGTGMLSERGLEVVLTEAALFLPFFLVAAWPKRR